ncbi:MAG: hypothetical protein K9M44_04130 [Candidatus Pacebacteria bacterium]|nr:hypothetical protein [Candidatus Paceibacterota bacterium]
MKTKKRESGKLLKKNWRLLVVIFLSILFFFIASSYNYISQSPDYVKWGSPDENANYVFSKIYAEEGSLTIKEKHNLQAAGLIAPRSFKSDGIFLKPLSFLGIILIYGNLAKIFSTSALPYLTPFFAGLGLIFFFLFIKRVFTEKIAFLSSLLLFSFPVYIYYSMRSLFHNVLFIVFVIIFLFFLTYIKNNKNNKGNKLEKKSCKLKWKEFKANFFSLKINKSKTWSLTASFLSGLFLGLALITRTAEALWLLPLLFLGWLFYFRSISLSKLVLFLAGLWLGLLPMFLYNQILYGAMWQGGYNQMNQSLAQIGQASSQALKSVVGVQSGYLYQAWQVLADNIFYFGFKPWQSVMVFYLYFIKMFWWIFAPAAIGFLMLLAKIYKWPKKYWYYILAWLFLSLILIFYYGSWKFTDNPDPSSHTIGNSYTRYWLPIYLGAIPLAAYFLDKFSSWFFKSRKTLNFFFKQAILYSIFIAIFLMSFYFLIFGSEEGMYYSYLKFQQGKYVVKEVFRETEYNAVIVTQYHDKLLFPERKVINGLLSDNNMNRYYAVVAKSLPLYYFNFTFPEKDFNYLNQRKLAEVGLCLQKVKDIGEDFSLYRLFLK